MKALVSIIIPTYNRSSLLKQTLDVVLDQNYKNWECIIVDDGSTDATSQLLQNYSEKDPRFSYISRPLDVPKGAAACRNIGISRSKGKYLQFLDSDDIITPEKISAQVERMENDEDLSVITCKWGRFMNDQDDAEVFKEFLSYNDFDRPEDFFNALPKSLNFFPIHAYLIRRKTINKAGYWNEYLNFNEDAEFMSRIIANSQKIGFSKEGLALYRLPIDKNVSEYTDIKKVRDGLTSWKLIELYLRIRFGNEVDSFIKKGKGEFFLSIKGFPGIIEQEKIFFKEQIKSDTSKSGFLKRLRKKLN